MERLIKKYTDLGVRKDKIVVTEAPSMCIWSLSRGCLVGGKDQPPTEEVIKDGDNYRVSYENNCILSLQNRESINIREINESEGIVITDATYGTPYFRFAFIPGATGGSPFRKPHIKKI